MQVDVILTTGDTLRLDTEDDDSEASFVAEHWLGVLTNPDHSVSAIGENGKPLALGYEYADGRSFVAALRPEHVVGVRVTE